MCFTIPKKIIKSDGKYAMLEGGLRADVSFLEECKKGDYVIVTNGIAVLKVEKPDAKSIRSLIKKTHEKLP